MSHIESNCVKFSHIKPNWEKLSHMGKIQDQLNPKIFTVRVTAASTSFYRHCAITENGRDAFLMIRESILKGIQSTADAFVM